MYGTQKLQHYAFTHRGVGIKANLLSTPALPECRMTPTRPPCSLAPSPPSPPSPHSLRNPSPSNKFTTAGHGLCAPSALGKRHPAFPSLHLTRVNCNSGLMQKFKGERTASSEFPLPFNAKAEMSNAASNHRGMGIGERPVETVRKAIFTFRVVQNNRDSQLTQPTYTTRYII